MQNGRPWRSWLLTRVNEFVLCDNKRSIISLMNSIWWQLLLNLLCCCLFSIVGHCRIRHSTNCRVVVDGSDWAWWQWWVLLLLGAPDRSSRSMPLVGRMVQWLPNPMKIVYRPVLVWWTILNVIYVQYIFLSSHMVMVLSSIVWMYRQWPSLPPIYSCSI